MATAIVIGVVVIIIPNHAAATTDTVLPAVNSDTAVRARCHPCHIGGPIGNVVVDDDTVVADAPAAPPLPPLDATDPMVVTWVRLILSIFLVSFQGGSYFHKDDATPHWRNSPMRVSMCHQQSGCLGVGCQPAGIHRCRHH